MENQEMKTTAELKAELAGLYLVRNLAKVSGRADLVSAANSEMLEIATEISAREGKNKEQVRLYKSATRGK